MDEHNIENVVDAIYAIRNIIGSISDKRIKYAAIAAAIDTILGGEIGIMSEKDQKLITTLVIKYFKED